MKKITKKLFSSLFTSTLLLSPLASFSGEVSTNTTDLGFFVSEDPTNKRNNDNTLGLYKLSSDGTVTRLQADIFPDVSAPSFSADSFTVDEREGKIYFLEFLFLPFLNLLRVYFHFLHNIYLTFLYLLN